MFDVFLMNLCGLCLCYIYLLVSLKTTAMLDMTTKCILFYPVLHVKAWITLFLLSCLSRFPTSLLLRLFPFPFLLITAQFNKLSSCLLWHEYQGAVSFVCEFPSLVCHNICFVFRVCSFLLLVTNRKQKQQQQSPTHTHQCWLWRFPSASMGPWAWTCGESLLEGLTPKRECKANVFVSIKGAKCSWWQQDGQWGRYSIRRASGEVMSICNLFTRSLVLWVGCSQTFFCDSLLPVSLRYALCGKPHHLPAITQRRAMLSGTWYWPPPSSHTEQVLWLTFVWGCVSPLTSLWFTNGAFWMVLQCVSVHKVLSNLSWHLRWNFTLLGGKNIRESQWVKTNKFNTLWGCYDRRGDPFQQTIFNSRWVAFMVKLPNIISWQCVKSSWLFYWCHKSLFLKS